MQRIGVPTSNGHGRTMKECVLIAIDSLISIISCSDFLYNFIQRMEAQVAK